MEHQSHDHEAFTSSMHHQRESVSLVKDHEETASTVHRHEVSASSFIHYDEEPFFPMDPLEESAPASDHPEESTSPLVSVEEPGPAKHHLEESVSSLLSVEESTPPLVNVENSASARAKAICNGHYEFEESYELPPRATLSFDHCFGLHPRELFLSVTLPKELSGQFVHEHEKPSQVMVRWDYWGRRYSVNLDEKLADPQHPTNLFPETDSHGNSLTMFVSCDAKPEDFEIGGDMENTCRVQSYIEYISCGNRTYVVAADIKAIRIILQRLENYGFDGMCIKARNFLTAIQGRHRFYKLYLPLLRNLTSLWWGNDMMMRCTVVFVPKWNKSSQDPVRTDMQTMCHQLMDILEGWGEVRRYEILETAINGLKVEDAKSLRVPKGPCQHQLANNPTLSLLMMYVEFYQAVTAEQIVRSHPEPYRFGCEHHFQLICDHAGPIRNNAAKSSTDTSEEMIDLDQANKPLPAGYFSATMREFQYAQNMGHDYEDQEQDHAGPTSGHGGATDSNFHDVQQSQLGARSTTHSTAKHAGFQLLPLLNKSTRIGRNFNNHDKKNQVVIQNVASGEDIRTTVMLRNIPNKITQPQIQSILEWTSFGKFDFLYLRIDFANNCNVGYAFINFIKPEYIVDFVQQVRGQKWWNSEKIAEVCYATIQGVECLVAKFRNSSVMLEEPCYRPKLFATEEDGDPGQEKPFPAPDNFHKLARSNQNAAQIGLFSPMRGTRGRNFDGSRHRKFDKGNSYSMMEDLESDYSWFCMATGTNPVEKSADNFGSHGRRSFE